jgi:hypothetical protein
VLFPPVEVLASETAEGRAAGAEPVIAAGEL